MEENQPVMSRAQRRKLRNPQPPVTAEVKAQARADLIELRREMRILKANGKRGKWKKHLAAKRARDEEDSDEDDAPAGLGAGFFKPSSRAIDREAPALKKKRMEAPDEDAMRPVAKSGPVAKVKAAKAAPKASVTGMKPRRPAAAAPKADQW